MCEGGIINVYLNYELILLFQLLKERVICYSSCLITHLGNQYMQTYNVFYLVSGDDEENQNISDTATLSFDAEDLDDLYEILQKGEEDGSIQPKLKTIAIEGDIRIEYVLIYDSKGNEVFHITDFTDKQKAKWLDKKYV